MGPTLCRPAVIHAEQALMVWDTQVNALIIDTLDLVACSCVLHLQSFQTKATATNGMPFWLSACSRLKSFEKFYDMSAFGKAQKD